MIAIGRSGMIAFALACAGLNSVPAASPIELGDRLELFVDAHLIDQLKGTRLTLHAPEPRETVLSLDAPWEGIYSGYFTVLEDQGKYRMYYRGMPEAHHDFDTEVTCYAESGDGIHWTKPELGLFEVRGTRRNNIILARHRACHNFAPFKDQNPAAAPEQSFKALGGTGAPGLVALSSADGIHWKEIQPAPVITQGAFDSQNVSFWSVEERQYVCYFRIFHHGVRWISRTTSKDFLDWTTPVALVAEGAPNEHLYTNQLKPYPRAPHLYLGTPTRFFPGRKVLTDAKTAELGTARGFDFRNDCADIVLISTRGGNALDRTFMESYIRPGRDQRNWTSRASYAAYGLIQTGPDELSLYVNHNCGYPTSHIRRYVMRLDGFASVQAPYAGGELLTKPFRFNGGKLLLNYATSAAGGIRVEIQTEGGQPIEGFKLEQCPEIIGDQIARAVEWKGGADVSRLAGQAVRLRCVMKDADLYSLRFGSE